MIVEHHHHELNKDFEIDAMYDDEFIFLPKSIKFFKVKEVGWNLEKYSICDERLSNGRLKRIVRPTIPRESEIEMKKKRFFKGFVSLIYFEDVVSSEKLLEKREEPY